MTIVREKVVKLNLEEQETGIEIIPQNIYGKVKENEVETEVSEDG